MAASRHIPIAIRGYAGIADLDLEWLQVIVIQQHRCETFRFFDREYRYIKIRFDILKFIALNSPHEADRVQPPMPLLQ
jgi:hypothetical protein